MSKLVISNMSLLRHASAVALGAGLLWSGGAAAQTPVPTTSVDQKKAAEVVDPARPDAAEERNGDRGDQGAIVVTGSRIQRAGFNAPTPTTVLGDVELREGNPVSIGQVLNDSPAFRSTSTPTTTTGDTNNSAEVPDLRGLGPERTLTLLNGHRFVGSADLNTIPKNLVKRIDVVTGSASAAYGSGAVAGVVNIILDDALKGITLDADTGISTRDDDPHYHFDGSAGTSFADGRGHVMIAGDFFLSDGAFGRESRPNLRSAIFQQTNNQLILANNVQYTIINTGGVIAGGRGAGLVFNHDGSLTPLQLGSQTSGNFTINGNGQSLYDFVAVTSPYERNNVFARTSYEFSPAAKLWIDGSYTRVASNFPFFPTTPFLTVQADNAFLTPTARAQLAAVGATYPLTVGRIITDVGPTGYLGYQSSRRTLEGSIGLEGDLGHGIKYTSYYDHGETRDDESIYNQTVQPNFARAVDAVAGPNGTPICRVNAGPNPATPDPACQPLNLLGQGNASAAAVAYAFGAGREIATTKLDATGVSFTGQPIRTWAGPVDVALGGDFRWESLHTDYIDPLSLANALGTLNFTATDGSFNVQEGFGELNVPLLNAEHVAHLEVNGAARYSNYSTSGGIWSWKVGGTGRLFDDFLLRSTYSRDIRSPTIAEYFTNNGVAIGTAQDPYRGVTQANVTSFVGGNRLLTPETSHTLTIGGSYTPHFAHGFNVSVDYYNIDIRNVIATLALQDTLTSCHLRSPGDPTCGGVVQRNPDGSIASVVRTYRNLAAYKTRGLDMEASYLLPLERVSGGLPGTLRFRALATHVFDLLINDGVHVTDRAGIVGDTVTFSTPKWRATGSVTYQDQQLAVDLRVRYVDGGIFSNVTGANGLLIANNNITSRTYVDLGLQMKVKQVTVFANVNNLFDRDPPYVTYTSAIYDQIGRYFNAGVKLKF